LPLSYLGEIKNVSAQPGEVADYWVCAPGANVIHFRRESEEEVWRSYAGGDPRSASKAAKAGRVVMGLTSAEPYWIWTAIRSVKQHFAKAEKFITNLELPPNAKDFKALDPADPQQAADLAFYKAFEGLAAKGEWVHNQKVISLDADGRFLAKLALAVGYKMFGSDFLQTDYGLELRKAFREANPALRKGLRVRGSGYARGLDLGDLKDQMRWPGGWLLLLRRSAHSLELSIFPPSGRILAIQVSDDAALIRRLASNYSEGVVWLTVPAVGKAIGPMTFPDYVAYKTKVSENPELKALDALRGDPSRLPPTGIKAPR
jgi:hypothetical protein